MAAAIQLSHNDKDREYRHVVLANQMEVLLISDPTTEKAAACCDVRVGSMQDPAEAPGLAHFLEHMLFLGTETYPVENAYSSFLNAHGGMSNAYTASENTVYYFDVVSDSFDEALNMFASFFICPLFSADGTTREINAVDSENSKNLLSDIWRHQQLFRSKARQDHPFSGFSTGNKDTLGREGLATRDIMIKFYEQYYSSNMMKLVLYGKESLDVLQQYAESKFSKVLNKNLTAPSVPQDPYRAEHMQRMLEVVPIKDVKTLDVYFPIPGVEELYLTKPTRYLSHLVGHEGGGSILAALKAKGWANGLSSYNYQSTSCFAFFSVGIELTDAGVEHRDEVVECVFAYIGLLKRQGPKDWIAQEIIDTAALGFRFLNKTDPSDYVIGLANNMHIVAPEHIVSAEHLIFEKKPEACLPFLDRITPSNCLIFIKHKGLAGKTTETEKWYSTCFNDKPFDTQAQTARFEAAMAGGTAWDAELSLPEPNPFIPTDFDIRNEPLPSPPSSSDAEPAASTVVSKPIKLQSEATLVDNQDLFVAEGEAAAAGGGGGGGVGGGGAAVAEVADKGGEDEGEGEEGEEEGEEDEEDEEGGAAAGEVPPLGDVPGRMLTTWFCPDSKWLVPKVNVMVSLQSLSAFATPLGVALTDLMAKCLKELLSEFR